jgi:hypothetical protein
MSKNKGKNGVARRRRAGSAAWASRGLGPNRTLAQTWILGRRVAGDAGLGPRTSARADASPATAEEVLALPRELQRPAFREVSRTALTAIDGEPADVPIQYLQDKLRDFGERYVAALRVRCVHV